MTTPATYEQRRFPRVPLQYPIKLTTGSLGLRYLAGRTCNLSAGGAYIELQDAANPLPIGTHVSIALPKSPNEVLLSAEQCLSGTVVRSAHHPRGLGVRFDRPVTIAVPAA